MSEELTDGTERETVWVTGRQAGGGPERAIHTRRDCPIVESAHTVFEKDRSVFPDNKPVCNTCSGEIDQPETQDHSYLKSLKAAAEADGE